MAHKFKKIWVVSIMVINNNVQAVAGTYAATHGRNARHTGGAGKMQFRDELLISQEAQNFNAMLQKLKNVDDVRMDKVEFYANAIQSGNYSVPSADIADKMLLGGF